MNLLLEEVRARLFAQEQIDKETALQLVLIDEQEELYMLADEVRRHFMGNYFDLCSIINAKAATAQKIVVSVPSLPVIIPVSIPTPLPRKQK